MAKIRNTSIPNYFGDGYEKEITLDNGEEYIIRNSSIPNYFGDGYEQEIVKKQPNVKTNNNGPLTFMEIVVTIIGTGIIAIIAIFMIYILFVAFSNMFSALF